MLFWLYNRVWPPSSSDPRANGNPPPGGLFEFRRGAGGNLSDKDITTEWARLTFLQLLGCSADRLSELAKEDPKTEQRTRFNPADVKETDAESPMGKLIDVVWPSWHELRDSKTVMSTGRQSYLEYTGELTNPAQRARGRIESWALSYQLATSQGRPAEWVVEYAIAVCKAYSSQQNAAGDRWWLRLPQAVIERADTRAQAYLAKAAAQPGAVKTDSGLVYRELRAGSGPSPTPGDTVKVNYGTEFNSSYSRNAPAEFVLNRVIPCWTEGLQKMGVVSKAQLVCPSNLAYGDGDAPRFPEALRSFSKSNYWK